MHDVGASKTTLGPPTGHTSLVSGRRVVVSRSRSKGSGEYHPVGSVDCIAKTHRGRSWQHEASSRVEQSFREVHVFPRLLESGRALVRFQSDTGSGVALLVSPSSIFTRLPHSVATRSNLPSLLNWRVQEGVFVRDLDVAVPNALDGRRLEVVADGLPSWPWTRRWCHPFTPTDLRTVMLLTMGPESRARLVVLALETGGRWSDEAMAFVCLLARAKVRSDPRILKKRVELTPMVVQVGCAAARAFWLRLLERLVATHERMQGSERLFAFLDNIYTLTSLCMPLRRRIGQACTHQHQRGQNSCVEREPEGCADVAGG